MIKKISHVGVVVKDMDRALDFYLGFLGFKLLRRARTSDLYEVAFLTLDGEEHSQIELVCGPDTVANVGVVNHIAFEVDNIEEMLSQIQQYGLEVIDKAPKTKPALNIKHAFFWGPGNEKMELVQKN